MKNTPIRSTGARLFWWGNDFDMRFIPVGLIEFIRQFDYTG
jgi:hypothetical protein